MTGTNVASLKLCIFAGKNGVFGLKTLQNFENKYFFLKKALKKNANYFCRK
jgi:recombinational DNA repair protein RecR